MRVITLREFDNSGLYEDTLKDLRSIIESEFGTVAKFCTVSDISRFNLSRCWPEEGKKPKDMSVGLYLRICIALGIMDKGVVTGEQLDFSMSLRDYLVIDNNAVMKSVILINRL